MLFKIKSRWTGALMFEVEIECRSDASDRVKLGRAVLQVTKERKDLRGADLQGADLRGADLQGAVAKVESLVTRVTRSDGYEFFGFRLEDGSLHIEAGCQSRTLPSYRKHVAEDYPKRGDDGRLASETTDILDFIEKRFAALPKL
jgi:hypothetical protein